MCRLLWITMLFLILVSQPGYARTVNPIDFDEAVVEIYEKDRNGFSTRRFIKLDSEQTLDITGANIALEALGGKVESATEWDNTNWRKRHINDGVTVILSNDYRTCIVCGWSSRYNDTKPEVVLSFYKERKAKIAAVFVDLEIMVSDQENVHQWYPRTIEIQTSEKSATSGFETIITTTLSANVTRQLIPLPEGTTAKYLKVKTLESSGQTAVALGEIGVIEAEVGKDSILYDAEIDLANLALGGVFVTYSDFKDQSATALIDQEGGQTHWRAADATVPQDFILSFPGNHVAFVDRVRLTLSATTSAQDNPQEIAIAISDHPLDGFQEVKRVSISKTTRIEEVLIEQDARFVKIRITKNHGGDTTRLGKIAVIEGRRSGYASLLYNHASSTGGITGQVLELTKSKRKVNEEEPNNDMTASNPLKWDKAAVGRIEPLGETDWFALPAVPAKAKGSRYRLSGEPYIRHDINVLDDQGEIIHRFRAKSRLEKETEFSFELTKNEAYLEISEPPSSVVVIWDTSLSMKGSEKDLENAVRTYIDQAPVNQRIRLIRFNKGVELINSEFTSDKKKLKSLLAGKFVPEGNTALYDAVLTGVSILQKEMGNTAIILMSDGEHTNYEMWHGDFWKRFDKERSRMYTIGLGNGLKRFSDQYATTGERVLQHLSLATGGEAFFTKDSERLVNFYERIASELTEPATYTLQPSLTYGSGHLHVQTTESRVNRAATPRIHFAVDASHSTNALFDDDTEKWQAVVEEIDHAVKRLDEGASVAVTAFGGGLRESEDSGCQYTESIVPFGALVKERFSGKIQAIEAKGNGRPLSAGIDAAARSFRSGKSGVLIVVTDGADDCEGNPLDMIDKAKERGFVGKIHVIDTASSESVDTSLQIIAEAGGGKYYRIQNRNELKSALRAAMAAEYVVKDMANTVIEHGFLGTESVNVPPGMYEVEILAAAKPVTTSNVDIERDALTKIDLRNAGDQVHLQVEPPLSLKEASSQYRCGSIEKGIHASDPGERVQLKLKKLGFDVGEIDGNVLGTRTIEAVKAFQTEYSLIPTGEVNSLLNKHLNCVINTGSVFIDVPVTLVTRRDGRGLMGIAFAMFLSVMLVAVLRS